MDAGAPAGIGPIGPNDLDLIYLTDDVDDAVRHIREACRGAWRGELTVASGSRSSAPHRTPSITAGLDLARDVGAAPGGPAIIRSCPAGAGRHDGHRWSEPGRPAATRLGVIPQSLVDLEVADHEADELVITDGMAARKTVMVDRADAFPCSPAGSAP